MITLSVQTMTQVQLQGVVLSYASKDTLPVLSALPMA